MKNDNNLYYHFIDEIKNNETPVRFSKGDTIFKEGSPVKHLFYLQKGLIKLVKEKPEEEFIVSIIHNDTFFGLSSSYSTDKFHVSAYALDESYVNYIEIGYFRSLIRSDGYFAEQFIKVGINIEMGIINRMISLFGKQLPGKLSESLLFFSDVIFKNNSFFIPLNRQELANYIGVSVKSLNKTLKDFHNDGLIEIKKNEIHILKKEVLLRLSKTG